MDRNLGAHGASFEGHGSITNTNPTHPGSLYYQFGRKDPFPCIVTKYLNGYTYGTASSQQDFEYAVNHPNTFVCKTGNWCNDPNGQSSEYIWNDHKIGVSAYNTGKSIFDPSPWGFRVPIFGTWDGFDSDRDGSEYDTMYEYPHFLWATIPYNEKAGRIYREFAYFPTSGSRNCTTGDLINGGIGGCSWSAAPSSSTAGYYLSFSSTYVNPSTSNHRAYGFPVRPIQE